MPPNESRYRVQSLDRAVDVLEAIESADRGLTVTEVAAAVGASKSAVFATLHTLAERGLVLSQGQGSGRVYRLGFALARLGQHALSQVSLRDAAMPVLTELTERTRMSSRVASLEAGLAVIVGQVNAPGLLRFDLRMGHRELPHCTGVGKALLAQLPLSRAREVAIASGMPRRTGRTIVDIEELLPELERTRQRGYALDREEDAEGIVCVGAPVWDHTGACVGAISATGLLLDMGEEDLHGIGEIVHAHANRLSRHLQGHPG
ncbi:IclR family transcriptional regulator [Spongiactinospora sp. TRM90649]|uniref:IclR family transcriptional regulator n=1 Tax=Spongiactinospora sp. TRM90649 TaxID=3031114 RepID=UPI0023F941C6|nr:IclR family transcriptional regulator [Spongiactinospora sp. TRM90649]MDF5757032.1 IclR family transcriptional regulator [Spongiactinospora sp. TRM90649]